MYSYKKIYIQGHQILSRLRLQKDKTIYIGRNQNKKNFCVSTEIKPQRVTKTCLVTNLYHRNTFPFVLFN